jgi:mRNA-degrading endonuclease RelE of RelBE toxin-antitoxin system
MPSDSEAQADVEVKFTSDFKRNVRQLAKRYRRIKSDLQPVIESLEKGETPGDQVPRIGEERVIFKVRVRNSDSAKGKSGGYRMIYWVESDRSVVLITIYSKTDQGDVAAEYIRRVIAEHDRPPAEDDSL